MILASNPLEKRRIQLVRWAGAAVFVVGVHVGCAAYALMSWTEDEAEDSAASPVLVEMAAAPAPPPVDSPDVAHGPLTEEAMQTPPAAKEAKEEIEKEMPTVEPSPAPEPEVVLPKSQPVTDKKPDEETPHEDKPQQHSADQAVAAPLTMAPPRVESKEQPAAPTPSPGAAAAAARAQARWEKTLVSHLNRFKRYPDAARARGSQGDVGVAFTIDRTGVVVASRILRSSGSSALDDEAMSVLQRASPLPAPPSELNDASLNLTLPIQFRIK
jgi:protein TonB